MTNRERARSYLSDAGYGTDMGGASGKRLDQETDRVSDLLDEADARGRRAGIAEAAKVVRDLAGMQADGSDAQLNLTGAAAWLERTPGATVAKPVEQATVAGCKHWCGTFTGIRSETEGPGCEGDKSCVSRGIDHGYVPCRCSPACREAGRPVNPGTKQQTKG